MCAAVELAASTHVRLPAEPGEWVMLMPADVGHRDGQRWTMNAVAVAAQSAKRAAGADVVIDYEHQTERSARNGLPAPAAGWIREFAARDGALWGRVEWTERAQGLLEAREYRFISPSFLFDEATREVLVVLRAALTNAPALAAMPALANDVAEETTMKLEELLKKLGLDAGADDAAIDAALTVAKRNGEIASAAASALGVEAPDAEAVRAALAPPKPKPQADPPADKFVPRAEYDRLAAEVQTVREAQASAVAEQAVDAATAAGKLAPSLREWALGQAKADPAAFAKFVENAPALHPVGSAATPATASAVGPTKSAAALASEFGVKEKSWTESGKRLGAPA